MARAVVKLIVSRRASTEVDRQRAGVLPPEETLNVQCEAPPKPARVGVVVEAHQQTGIHLAPAHGRERRQAPPGEPANQPVEFLRRELRQRDHLDRLGSGRDSRERASGGCTDADELHPDIQFVPGHCGMQAHLELAGAVLGSPTRNATLANGTTSREAPQVVRQVVGERDIAQISACR